MIQQLDSRNEAAFYTLVETYLPDSRRAQLARFSAMFPNAFLLLLHDDRVVGAAFGWDRKLIVPEDDSFVLNGIAILGEYRRKGYGKALLRAFEQAAKAYGAPAVSLGSAPGYAEAFYLDCGYQPVEYKYWLDGSPVIEKVYADTAEYHSYVRKNKDGFVVMRKEL